MHFNLYKLDVLKITKKHHKYHLKLKNNSFKFVNPFFEKFVFKSQENYYRRYPHYNPVVIDSAVKSTNFLLSFSKNC